LPASSPHSYQWICWSLSKEVAMFLAQVIHKPQSEKRSCDVSSSSHPQASATREKLPCFSHMSFSLNGEVAMFLAQIMHKVEERCMKSHCPGDYVSPGDKPDKHYFGRGYIQLSRSYNYWAASKAIFGDSNVLFSPRILVAWHWMKTCPGMLTAFWYRRENVHIDGGTLNAQFGSSTRKSVGGTAWGVDVEHGWPTKKCFGLHASVLRGFHPRGEPEALYQL
jgi:hypothetical protein